MPADGWAVEDTLRFTVPQAQQATLCLRLTADYPYQAVDVKVNGRTTHLPIADKQGRRKGNGIAYYNIQTPIALGPADTLITVTHAMRRLTLPGITDVGIEIAQ